MSTRNVISDRFAPLGSFDRPVLTPITPPPNTGLGRPLSSTRIPAEYVQAPATATSTPSGTTLEDLVVRSSNRSVAPLAADEFGSRPSPSGRSSLIGGTPLSNQPNVTGFGSQRSTPVIQERSTPIPGFAPSGDRLVTIGERSDRITQEFGERNNSSPNRTVAATPTTVATVPVIQRVGPNGLDQLQRLILKQRIAELTSLELRDLLTPPISPELVLYLEAALRLAVINPSNLLVQAIARATTKETLVPIALALRYGANPNTYVNVPGVGTMHILGYVYTTLQGEPYTQVDSPVVNAIIIMLVISGARPVMPIFDPEAGRVRSHVNTMDRLERSQQAPSTLIWLSDQGYSTILPDIQDGFGLVEPGFMNQIGILLDRNDLITIPPAGLDLQLAFTARANGILSRWLDRLVVETPSDEELRVFLNEQGLSGLAIDFLNAELFRRLVDLGYIPDYNTINLLLVRMRQYQTIRDRLSSQEIEAMLLEAVRFGTTLDRDQFAMLASMPFGRAFVDVVLQEYNQPYWKKACRQANTSPLGRDQQQDPLHPVDTQSKVTVRPTQVPSRLRRLAVSLGVDPSQNRNEICEALDRLASADPDRLRQAAIRRQQTRISANLANVNEYIGLSGSTPPMLVCRNQSMMDQHGNPYEYNDLDLAAYRDGSGAVWCFTRDMFENILETNVNPYSLQPLPESFRIAVQNQLDMSRRLGLLETRPVRFTEAIEQLRSKDNPDPSCAGCTDESTRIVDTLVQTGTLYGVPPERLRNLTRPQMEQLLQVMGSEPLPLASLTTSHALVTFARQVQDVLRRQPDLATMFFSNLIAMV